MRALPFLLHAAVATLKTAGDAIASSLWFLNFHGALPQDYCFMLQNSKISGVLPCVVTKN